MPHQEEGVAFLLSRKSGLLAFEQGLGKTRIAIETFRRLRSAGKADRLLVICPNSLKRIWVAEAFRFAPELSCAIIEGSARVRRRAIDEAKSEVVVVNFELARTEVMAFRAFMHRRRFVLVIDESHNVKNRQSLNSLASQDLGPLAEYRWLLSGTPVTNRPSDLYAQIGIVAGQAVLGSFDSFQAEYEDASSSPEAAARLATRVAPYLLRRTKDQCLTLPDKSFIDISVQLPDWQRKYYDDLRSDVVREVQGMSPAQFRNYAPTALGRLVRLSQVASNPQLLFPNEERIPGKITKMDQFIDRLVSGGQKVIVWSHYVRTIERLVARYERHGVVMLYGRVPESDRQSIARRFQEDSTVNVLVANPAAAGSGFTLTAASYAIYETLSWRYDFYAQSQDRNHRIGQTKNVQYARLIASETIDEAIAQSLHRKSAMARRLLSDSGGGPRIGQMTTNEFCQLLLTNRLPETAAGD